MTIIDKIQDVKKKREELASLERDLRILQLTNYTKIADIHQLMIEECPEADTVRWRRLFIFIVVLFFCPNTLVGKKLPKGMRLELKKYIKGVSSCTLSYYVNGLFLNYRLYKDFRNEVERLFGLARLRLNI